MSSTRLFEIVADTASAHAGETPQTEGTSALVPDPAALEVLTFKIRSEEAESACKILKARPLFADQIDGATEVTPARYTNFNKLIAGVNPDVVLTQWPVDGHRDHRVSSLLTYEAWVSSGKKFALYYYEVDLGSDTQCFRPTHYVDVAAVERLKRKACMAHESQNPTGFYLQDHVPMLRFRGMECGCKLAEAFIHHDQSPSGGLPV